MTKRLRYGIYLWAASLAHGCFLLPDTDNNRGGNDESSSTAYSCSDDDYDCILSGLSFREGFLTFQIEELEATDEPLASAYVVDNTSYVYFDFAKTWSEARLFMQNADGDLAAFETAGEYDEVHGYLGNDKWIGLNDQDTEGQWVWPNGDTATFFDWGDGEPVNDVNKNCVYIVGTPGGTWATSACENATRSAVGEWASLPEGFDYGRVEGNTANPTTVACRNGKRLTVESASLCWNDCQTALTSACGGKTECTIESSLCGQESCDEPFYFSVICETQTGGVISQGHGEPIPLTYVDVDDFQDGTPDTGDACPDAPSVNSVSDYLNVFSCAPTKTGKMSPQTSDNNRVANEGDMHIKWTDPKGAVPTLCFAVCPNCTQHPDSGRCLRPVNGPPQGCSKSLACIDGHANGAQAGDHFVYFDYAKFPEKSDVTYSLVVLPLSSDSSEQPLDILDNTGKMPCAGTGNSVMHTLKKVESMCLPGNEASGDDNGGADDCQCAGGYCTYGCPLPADNIQSDPEATCAALAETCACAGGTFNNCQCTGLDECSAP